MNRSPLDTARYIFDAFARGDIPALLGCLADDVEWEYGPCSQNVPWYQNRRGIEGATAFFQSLAEVEFHKFDTTAFLAAGATVVVLVDSDYSIRKNGKRVVYEDAAFVVKCDAKGKIRRFAHRVDLHQAWLAYNSPSAA
jgi:hypothetical protein